MPPKAQSDRGATKRPGGKTPNANRVRLPRPGYLHFALKTWRDRPGVTLWGMEEQTGIDRGVLKRYASGKFKNPFPQQHLDALVDGLPPDLGHLALRAGVSWARVSVRVYLELHIQKRLAAYRENGILDACQALCLQLLLEPPKPQKDLVRFLKRASDRGWWLPSWIPQRYRAEAQRQTSDQALILQARGRSERIDLALCRALEPFLDTALGRGLFPAEYLRQDHSDPEKVAGVALDLLGKQLTRELGFLPKTPAEQAADIVAEIMAGGTPAGIDAYLIELTRQNLRHEGLGPEDQCPCPLCLEISQGSDSRAVQQLLETMPAEVRYESIAPAGFSEAHPGG